MSDHPRPGTATRRREPDTGAEVWEGIWELRQEVRALRRANPRSRRRSVRARRRFAALLGATVIAIVAVALPGRLGHPASLAVPSAASLAGLSPGQRIVAIAASQVGYRTDPAGSYCNRFSAHWDAGSAGGCPRGEMSEKWCADFAAWAWQRAGVPVSYGFGPGQINAGAASFYEWGVAHGHWHPATAGYIAAPGDVAVYGLSLGAHPSAVHVAIVTGDPRGWRGPNVINGDGDRTGFSVVEAGTDQVRADAGRGDSTLAGYVSPA